MTAFGCLAKRASPGQIGGGASRGDFMEHFVCLKPDLNDASSAPNRVEDGEGCVEERSSAREWRK